MATKSLLALAVMIGLGMVCLDERTAVSQSKTTAAKKADGKRESAKGRVYDLDFAEGNGWCQALIDTGDVPNVVVTTKEHRMQTILETSAVLRLDVEVEFDSSVTPAKLTRVKLNIPAK